jgi:hypothetical protein
MYLLCIYKSISHVYAYLTTNTLSLATTPLVEHRQPEPCNWNINEVANLAIFIMGGNGKSHNYNIESTWWITRENYCKWRKMNSRWNSFGKVYWLQSAWEWWRKFLDVYMLASTWLSWMWIWQNAFVCDLNFAVYWLQGSCWGRKLVIICQKKSMLSPRYSIP